MKQQDENRPIQTVCSLRVKDGTKTVYLSYDDK